MFFLLQIKKLCSDDLIYLYRNNLKKIKKYYFNIYLFEATLQASINLAKVRESWLLYLFSSGSDYYHKFFIRFIL